MRSGLHLMLLWGWLPILESSAGAAELWKNGAVQAYLICPASLPESELVERTLNRYLDRAFGWKLPIAFQATEPGLYVVVGNALNNPTIRQLVSDGLRLRVSETGDEGFQILTHDKGDRRLIIVAANSTIGLKHGCQELVFFRLSATRDATHADWPIDIMMQPAFAYRASYMLPCWSAYDSVESWRRALEFNSELALNRNWFWLNGFPLLPQYRGVYEGTDLAELGNVRSLSDVCQTEGMKFLIGGGWFTWHHKETASGLSEHRVRGAGGEAAIEATNDVVSRGVQYYLDMVEAVPGADGLYLEPVGEGMNVDEAVWSKHVDALRRLTDELWKKSPNFEIAIAIGAFNDKAYRRAVHEIGPGQIHWFWCWGEPLAEHALSEHPLVLRWHTIGPHMDDFHGSKNPPSHRETQLTGLVTSWDPGMGFGNPWNGWAKMGADQPRDFHPYTIPYFSHQYWFRERCWNVKLTKEEFACRLARRLFDADMPDESIHHYLTLADSCPKPDADDEATIAKVDAFVKHYFGKGTPRNRDTINRMREAIDGWRRVTNRKQPLRDDF